MKLFAEKGFSAVGVREIAAEAGVSLGLVRTHFGSKEGLRAAIDAYVLQEIKSLYSNVIMHSGTEALENAVEDAVEWITRDRDELDALAHRLNPPGSPSKIEIWGWGWPIPSRVDEFATHTREILASPFVTGYCLDIEAKSWSTRDHGKAAMDARARELIVAIRKGARKPLMLSSHGRADLTPLPWDALAQLDAGMPQCYDAKGVKEPGFVARCVKSYRDLGFPVVIPTLGASATDAEQMRRQVEDTPPGLRAVSWWTWTQIGRSDERAAVVGSCCHPREARA